MQKKMSKMSEVDLVAQGVADHIKKVIHKSVAWQISDLPVNGDAYNTIHSAIMKRAIEYLHADTN